MKANEFSHSEIKYIKFLRFIEKNRWNSKYFFSFQLKNGWILHHAFEGLLDLIANTSKKKKNKNINSPEIFRKA